MKTNVKICGIRSLEIACVSVLSGADFLGFNFIPTSKRYINPNVAREIIQKLSKDTNVVGIFQNQPVNDVIQITKLCKLTITQLHGSESPEYCKQIQTTPIIKALSLDFDFDPETVLQTMKSYDVDYFLVDRKVQGGGKQLLVERVKEISSAHPLFLAGGLTPENVGDIIRIAHPFAVDVASGVETGGFHDEIKIKTFIKNVKENVYE